MKLSAVNLMHLAPLRGKEQAERVPVQGSGSPGQESLPDAWRQGRRALRLVAWPICPRQKDEAGD